jgi:hypothetical protein
VAPKGPFQKLRVALIADPLTRDCLAHECRIREVTPLNHGLVLRLWRPDLLLVESVWSGRRDAWKYRVAAYPDHPERSNAALRRVVARARDLGIPCVFWNKEDSVHFDRFIESATLFDIICTVDAGCVDRYRERIRRDVLVAPLMFAVQPAIHGFRGIGERRRRACFIGSYSHHIHERRRERQDMLLGAAARTLGLTVVDRNSGRKAAHYRYPSLPDCEVLGHVTHARTADFYRGYLASLNVNTIEDSETMFSRRLVEILACGGLAVTTPSLAVERHLKAYCHVVGSSEEAAALFTRLGEGYTSQDLELMRAGAEHVLRHHTWTQRLESVLGLVQEWKSKA